jgi:hypothetical protein
MVKEPEWVIEHEIETKVRELERQERELEGRLAEIRARERKEREREGKGPRKRAVSFISGLEKGAWQADACEAEQKLTHETSDRVASSDEEFAPDPYYENEADANKVEENGEDNFTPAVREMMKKCVRECPWSACAKLTPPLSRLRRLSGGGGSNHREEEEPDIPKVSSSSYSNYARRLRGFNPRKTVRED